VLQPYRVLDLTDARGWLAGFLLAQLGADVILAEPVGGYPRDHRFAAYNRGKRSVIVPDDAGPAELAGLARGADVVLHTQSSFGRAVDLGALRDAHPALVTVAITPYGESGPKSGWLASDLTLFAASGQMAVTGDSDRPPVRTSVPQAWLHAGADAAVGALAALAERERSGLGQHIDLSAQQAVTLTALPAVLFAAVGLEPGRRMAGGVNLGDTHLRWVYPTLDGHIALALSFGPMIGPYQARLMAWVYEEGHCDEAMRDKDWIGFGSLLATGEEPMSELVRAMDCIAALTGTKTKAELLDAAMERKLLIAPVSNSADVLASAQLAARGYWDEIDGVRYPGAIVKASRTPLAPLSAAPAVPDRDAGASWRVPAEPQRAPAEPQRAPTAPQAPVAAEPCDGPLAGLKVLDLAWVAAAPLATRVLACWGATVVRVESSHRPDLTRGALGHRDDILEVENAITWQTVNAGKLGLALDLSKPEARSVVLDLARWADVAIESFTAGTVARWGLGYDDLAAINPSLVMMSSCLMGQSGPLSTFAGFGNLSASIAGFFDVTGWPDRPPAGPYMAYTDYTSPRFTLCALLAALDHRRRTGEGQYLDFSQMEAAIHLLTPALLEYQLDGTLVTRRGNVDLDLCPHAVYPAHGTDAWIAIVCETDDQWKRLAREMRRGDLGELTTAERLARRDEIDELITAWTARQDATGLMYRLQQQGVPAHQVQNSGECFNDPQLHWREHFAWLDHPYVRRSIVDTPPQHFSRSRTGYAWPGPVYGQHATEVLQGILGYDDDRITELAIAGALE